MLRLPQLSFLTLSLLAASTSSYAEFHPSLFPFMPRVIGEGFFGDETLGEADALVPIYGNHGGIFYIDGMGKTGDDDGYLGSIGGGYRGIYNDRFLLGGYVFGDFNRVARGPHFPVVNPGLELMTSLWDIHVNGYFPTSPKQKVQGVFLGEQLGTTQYVSFAGHNQFDNLINLVEEVGNGVDGEVGLTLPMARNLRFYTGGYHFSFKESQDINGVIGGVEMPLNNYFTVSIRDSYDKVQKNTAQLTIRLTLGGMDKSGPPNVENRLLDPFRRHLGTWNTGSGIPSQEAYVNTGVRVLTRDNIWFFSSAGTPFVAANGFSNCTYENNCLDTSFSQTTVNSIDTISPNANFYLSSGSYGTFSGASTFVAPEADFLTVLTLNRGQSLYGRSIGFATSQLRIVEGSMELTGGNTYDSLFLINNNSEFFNGLIITGSNVRIANSVIGGTSNFRGYKRAVFVNEAQDVVIENSRLEAFVDNVVNTNIIATGISIVDSKGVQLINDTINVNATQRAANTISGRGIIIDGDDTGSIKVLNSQANVQVTNAAGVDAIAQGIVIDDLDFNIKPNILNSTINVNATSTGNGIGSTSVAQGILVQSGQVNVEDSLVRVNSLNETANGVSHALGYNVVNVFTTLRLFRTNANVTAESRGDNSSANSIGLTVNERAIASLEQTQINASSQARLLAITTGINAVGISTFNKATVSFAGVDITSEASANVARAIAIRGSNGLISETASINGSVLASNFTATANGLSSAFAEGLNLNQSEFKNLIVALKFFRADTYTVAATGADATAVGIEAANSSIAILAFPNLEVNNNAVEGVDFLSSTGSEIRLCSFLGFALSGECPLVGN
ncbi:inverse autotransporter beta-barrel domain-containing protein [Legionella hackeliae]|uniref:Inverse autotransporter beta-domain domain-containing protein n=2 Tax=Legionella hackeliae TaxID=449 RepID=A0A0A8UWA4_LEGHA|nr:inverse autotransporter beta-barrel domain-containing protein [Legionella hackeliae]KTD15251.1 hypothetical protein Lhac_0093 [Legionella hackeliae]CEK11382.1 exported protein of unknown function [Legionella hackeliae]STX48154.1 Protein of uncharacterised function (DUF3442) [Legionella hackeliae]